MERELLLLGLLKREKMHGYQLHDFIDSYMQTCVDIKKSTAYYLLDKMAQQGLVKRREEREGKRPIRHVYSITAAGESYFQGLLRQNLATYKPARYPSNTGLIFLDHLPTNETLSLLRRRHKHLTENLSQTAQAPVHSGSMQFVVEHQLALLQAELAWLESVIERLSQNPSKSST